MSVFRDRVAARHVELIDAAVGLTFGADDLIELRRVEIDRGWRSGRGRRRQRGLADGQRITNDGRHLGRVTMAADMHVEGRGARPQQVIVHGGDLEPAFDQLEHDRIDFAFKQHEVAHHHGFAMHRFERDPAAERQRRLDGDAIERHREIGARKAVAIARHPRRQAFCQAHRRPFASRCPQHVRT